MGKQQQQGEPHFEFLGPYGPVGALVALPAFLYFIYYFCSPVGVWSFASLGSIPPLSKAPLWSWQAFAVVFGWFAFQALLYVYLPGPMVPGVKLANGERLLYKCNGFFALLVTLAAVVLLASAKLVSVTYIYDHFLELLTAAIVLSFAVAIYMYFKSTLDRVNNLAPHGNTGYLVYDFFIGRQLNPREGDLFDWKFFCELRPGLIGWVLIDLSCLCAQYYSLGRVTNSMWLVVGFQTVYVFDALLFERAILTTMDIVYDGFGWMLSFGDLAWVPFLYTVQARYLVSNPVDLPAWGVAGCVLCWLLGSYIFRAANLQKNRFRSNPQDPSVSHLETLETKTGSKLLISGWWGISRHPNYIGDWLASLSYCLPTGFASPMPYLYFFYFVALLTHRQIRDDEKCRQKYGSDWDKYCSIVKYRIVPFVY